MSKPKKKIQITYTIQEYQKLLRLIPKGKRISSYIKEKSLQEGLENEIKQVEQSKTEKILVKENELEEIKKTQKAILEILNIPNDISEKNEENNFSELDKILKSEEIEEIRKNSKKTPLLAGYYQVLSLKDQMNEKFKTMETCFSELADGIAGKKLPEWPKIFKSKEN